MVYGDASGCRLQTSGTNDYRIIMSFLKREGYERSQIKVPASNPAVRERLQLMNSSCSPIAARVIWWCRRGARN